MKILCLYGGIEQEMDEELLERRAGGSEDEHKRERWIEYWYHGQLVHRSVHVHLKQGLMAGLTQGVFG